MNQIPVNEVLNFRQTKIRRSTWGGKKGQRAAMGGSPQGAAAMREKKIRASTGKGSPRRKPVLGVEYAAFNVARP